MKTSVVKMPCHSKMKAKKAFRFRTKVKTVTAPAGVVDVKGAVVTEDDAQLEELLSNLTATFSLAKAAPKSAEDILGVWTDSLKVQKAQRFKMCTLSLQWQ